MTVTAIRSSWDLAELLNTHAPLTEQDAAETPRNWIAGMWVAGNVYPLDEAATTDNLAVLADGTAAVRFSPAGTWEGCGGGHRTSVEGTQEHWCPADRDEWNNTDWDATVVRDWREVYVGQAGFAETTVYATIDEAKAAFDREVAEMLKMIAENGQD